MRPVLALLTDFGVRDPYVASMKGVILSHCRDACIVDVSHDVEPHDVASAAFLLEGCRACFPPGTAFVVVVDPGVGTERRGLAAFHDGRFYVAPDNGALESVLAEQGALVHEIRRRDWLAPQVSETFHGRDVFAPIAVRLATGTPLADVGPAVVDPIRLSATTATRTHDGVVGRVVHVDRFGNLITDLFLGRHGVCASQAMLVTVVGPEGEQRVPFVRTYGSVPQGTACALLGSNGAVEIAVNGASAARLLRLGAGASVHVRVGAPRGRGTDML